MNPDKLPLAAPTPASQTVVRSVDAISRFNRRCRIAAGLWLLIAIPASFLLRPTSQDFSAFYFAGAAVRTHHWELLYPDRAPNSPYFIFNGFQWKSGQLEFAAEHGMDGLQPFVGLPWNALFFAPLSRLGYQAAHRVWIGILIGCTFGTAYFAGRSYEIAAGRASRRAGLITLLAAISVLSYRSIRVGNVSPPTALAIAVATFSLLRRGKRHDGLAVIAVVLGGLLKYATVAVLPVMLLAGRVRMLAGIVLASLGIFLLTLWLGGWSAFHDFFRTVGSSFGGSTPAHANQSVWGLLLRVTRLEQLPESLRLAVQIIEFLMLAGLGWLMIRQPRRAWERGETVFAATSAIVCWMLIFSPVFWEHYAIYLQPFWGWMIWEGRGGWRKFAAWAAIALAWLPLPGIYVWHMPEPLNSMLLCSCCLILALAVQRLAQRDPTASTPGTLS